MAITFSTPTLSRSGRLQYTLTLDSSMPNLSTGDFTAVFNGSIDGESVVDRIIDGASVQLTGSGTTRTLTVQPTDNASGNIVVAYTPEGVSWNDPGVDSSEPFDIDNAGPGGQSGVSGQQSGQRGCHGANAYTYVFFRKSRTVPGRPRFTYCRSTHQVSISSGWTQNPVTSVADNEQVYMAVGRLSLHYNSPSSGEANVCCGTTSVSGPTLVRGPRGCDGDDGDPGAPGTPGRRGTDIGVVRPYYTTSSRSSVDPPTATYTSSGLSVSTSGWSSSRPSIPTGHNLFMSIVTGTIAYTSSGSVSFRCATPSTPIILPRGCPGDPGDTGCHGTSVGAVQTFYRTSSSGSVSPPHIGYNSSGLYTTTSGWTTTIPNIPSGHNLFMTIATGFLRYTSATNFNRFGRATCPTIIPQGCDGDDGDPGDPGVRGAYQRAYVFYKAAPDDTPPSAPTGAFSRSSSGVYRAVPSGGGGNWRTTPPNLSSGQSLYYVNAWGTVAYTTCSLTSDYAQTQMCIGPVTKIPRGCPGDDGDDGRIGSRQSNFVFYKASATKPTGTLIGTFIKQSGGSFLPTITSESGWSQNVPRVASNETLYYVNASGTIHYSTSCTNSSYSDGTLCISAIIEVPRGCEGDPGRRGSRQVAYTFYKARSRPPSPPSGTFEIRANGDLLARITSESGWTQTIPELTETNNRLFYVQTWGTINYSSDLESSCTAVSALCVGPVTEIPRGCPGEDGDDGDPGCPGRIGSRQVPYTFYKVDTSKPNRPVGTFRKSGNNFEVSISTTGWVSSPPALSSGQKLYYVNVWGTISYTTENESSSYADGLCVGEVVEATQGCRGQKGDEQRSYIFYKSSATTPSPAPSAGTFTKSGNTYTAELTGVTGWTLNVPTVPDGQELYYVQAWGTITYDAANEPSAVPALCVGSMVRVQRGCQGDVGPSGTKIRQFRYYARSNLDGGPSTAGITYEYDSGTDNGVLRFTSAAQQIWGASLGSGTATAWFIDIYGYISYDSDGNATALDPCIYGPFEVGGKGCTGDVGTHGNDVVAEVFYQAKSGLAPTAPSSATWNGTTFGNMEDWELDAPSTIEDDEELYAMNAWGYTYYSSENTVSTRSACFSNPFIIPRGCQGDPGTPGCPGTTVKVDVRYARSQPSTPTAPPGITGITFDTNGDFGYPSHWQATVPAGTTTAWEITVYGTLSYNSAGVVTNASDPCIYGPVQLGATGPRGIHGEDTALDVFYRRSTTTLTRPNNPATNTTAWVRTPPTGWYATPSAARTAQATGELYYLIARHWACHSETSSTYTTTYEEPIEIPRGCQGDSVTGPPGPCGTRVEIKVIYRRHATKPGISGINYNGGTFNFPTTWAEDASTLTGTDALWELTIYGTTDYTSGSPVYSHCIFGPIRAGVPGAQGNSAYFRLYYTSADPTPTQPGDGSYVSIGPPLNWYATYDLAKAVLDLARRHGNTTARIYILPASYTGTLTSGSVTYGAPFPIPEGEAGSQGQGVWFYMLYQRSATKPTAPTWDSDDSTTGTWDGRNYGTPDDWFTSVPSGTDNLYMMPMKLYYPTLSVSYGEVIEIPACVVSGGTTTGSGVGPDLVVDRYGRIFDAADNFIPSGKIRPLSAVVQTTKTCIGFRWTEEVNQFATTDVHLKTYTDGLGCAYLTWPDSRSCQGQKWNAVLNLPPGQRGTVEISVPPLAVESVPNDTCGPPTCKTVRIPFNTPAADTVAPTVCIRWSASESAIFFSWTEPVNGFEKSDITFSTSITTGTLEEITGDDYLARTVWKLPVTLGASAVTTTATIAVNSVTDDAGNQNPAAMKALVIPPSTSTTTPPSGTTLICSKSATIDDLDWLNSVSSRTPNAGGAFMGVSDFVKIGDYLYGVAQIIHRADGGGLFNSREAGAVIFRVDVDGTNCSVVKAYANITQAARSLTGFRNSAYWFEGSGYLYSGIVGQGGGHNADGNVGRVFSQTADISGCITNHGVNYRSRLGREGTSGFESDYGIHGATNSPMRVRGEELLLISGFGNFWNSQNPDDEYSDINNWQMLRFYNTLGFNIPVLRTNARTGWDIVTELARVTNSIVGFDKGRLVFRPRRQRTATLSAGLAAVDDEMEYNNGAEPLPTSGLILIDDELIEFTMEFDS